MIRLGPRVSSPLVELLQIPAAGWKPALPVPALQANILRCLLAVHCTAQARYTASFFKKGSSWTETTLSNMQPVLDRS